MEREALRLASWEGLMEVEGGAMSPPVPAPVRERCFWPTETPREEARRVASPPMVLKRDLALEMRVVV